MTAVLPAFPTIRTPRLTLRELACVDAPALFAIHGDPDHMRWFGSDPLGTQDDAVALIDLFASWRRQPNPGIRWGIQPHDSATLTGTCGLFGWNRKWRKCSIGYEIAPSLQGRGLMTEALRAVIAWSWDAMALNRIEAHVHPENDRSLRLLDRLGFVVEGTQRQAAFWGGSFHDMILLSLLRNDPPARITASASAAGAETAARPGARTAPPRRAW